MLDASKSDVVNAVGPFQYGAMMQCGTDRMVYNLRSLATASPDLLFIATDVKNAFGNIDRRQALAALLFHLTAFVPMMSLGYF